MKFKVKTDELRKFFNVAQSLTTKIDRYGVKNSVLFEIKDSKLSIKCTDLIHFVILTDLPIDEEVQNIKFACNSFYLQQFINRATKDIITFDVEDKDAEKGDGKVVLTSGSKMTLLLKSTYSIPVFPNIEDEFKPFDVALFKNYINTLREFTETDKADVLNVFAGVCFGASHIVSSNRIAIAAIKNTTSLNDGSVIMPSLYKLLNNIESGSIASSDKFISIKCDNLIIHTAKINTPDLSYPYDKIVEIIEKSKTVTGTRLTIKNNALTDVIYKCSPFVSPLNDRIDFYYDKGILKYKVDCTEGHRFVDNVAAECNENKFKFGLNLKIIMPITKQYKDSIDIVFDDLAYILNKEDILVITSYYKD